MVAARTASVTAARPGGCGYDRRRFCPAGSSFRYRFTWRHYVCTPVEQTSTVQILLLRKIVNNADCCFPAVRQNARVNRDSTSNDSRIAFVTAA